MVKPGGVVANLEFLVPASRFWHFWWWVYTRAVLPAGRVGDRGAGNGSTSGRFLGPNISSHYRRYPVSWTVGGLARRRPGRRRDRDPMSLGGGLVMWGRRAGG